MTVPEKAAELVRRILVVDVMRMDLNERAKELRRDLYATVGTIPAIELINKAKGYYS